MLTTEEIKAARAICDWVDRLSYVTSVDAHMKTLRGAMDRLKTGAMVGEREVLAKALDDWFARNEHEDGVSLDGDLITDALLASGIIARVPSKAEITAAIMGLIQPTERKIEQSGRPSIAQLEAILNSEDPPKVSIKPDGSVVEIVPASTTVGHVADAVLDLLKPKVL